MRTLDEKKGCVSVLLKRWRDEAAPPRVERMGICTHITVDKEGNYGLLHRKEGRNNASAWAGVSQHPV